MPHPTADSPAISKRQKSPYEVVIKHGPPSCPLVWRMLPVAEREHLMAKKKYVVAFDPTTGRTITFWEGDEFRSHFKGHQITCEAEDWPEAVKCAENFYACLPPPPKGWVIQPDVSVQVARRLLGLTDAEPCDDTAVFEDDLENVIRVIQGLCAENPELNPAFCRTYLSPNIPATPPKSAPPLAPEWQSLMDCFALGRAEPPEPAPPEQPPESDPPEQGDPAADFLATLLIWIAFFLALCAIGGFALFLLGGKWIDLFNGNWTWV
jgi:hypothetical protein